MKMKHILTVAVCLAVLVACSFLFGFWNKASPRGQRGLDSRGHLCDWRREGTGPGDMCWGAGQGAFSR